MQSVGSGGMRPCVSPGECQLWRGLCANRNLRFNGPMNSRDPHQALKTEVVAEARSRNAPVILARLQWGKDDVGYSLHVSPNTFSSYGIQTTDFLAMMGFERSRCAFTHGECFCRWVSQDFDVSKFAEAFDHGYASLTEAQKRLEACGFFLDQPEGWGFFYGREARSRRPDFSMSGDGHTGMKIQHMKQRGGSGNLHGTLSGVSA